MPLIVKDIAEQKESNAAKPPWFARDDSESQTYGKIDNELSLTDHSRLSNNAGQHMKYAGRHIFNKLRYSH